MSPFRRLVPFGLLAVIIAFVGYTAINRGYVLAAEPDMRVLFIGNSHTHVNDVPGSIVELGAANGIKIEFEMVAPGGHTLREHASDSNVQGLIASGDFDVIVLQEQSELPAHHTDFGRETAPAADAMARTAASTGTRVVYYQGWGRRDGSPYTGHTSYGAMQSAITGAYDALAADTGGTVAPVGETWRYVRNVAPHIELFNEDGNHASEAGSYIAAIVLTEVLADVDLAEAPSIGSIDDATATFLLNYTDSAPVG